MIDIQKRLFELQDPKYRDFHVRLIPTVVPKSVIGVRTPLLRAFAREVYLGGDHKAFMRELPHEYYEENNLHAFLIEQIEDYDDCMSELEVFLPYVDNWATCDGMAPKVFVKNTDRLYKKLKQWILSDNTYTVRFGIKTLMSLYAKEKFKHEHMQLVSCIHSDEYYVKMAVAWYFATVLAFHFEDACEFLSKTPLDRWTQNKAIQKARESYRISDECKEALKHLKTN